jgi:hypothetical protein
MRTKIESSPSNPRAGLVMSVDPTCQSERGCPAASTAMAEVGAVRAYSMTLRLSEQPGKGGREKNVGEVAVFHVADICRRNV